MSKELVEEIMALEEKAEQEIAKAEHDKEAMIRKAKEKATLLIQEAEHAMDTERQKLLASHDKTLHSQKQQALDSAQQQASTLRRAVDQRTDPATQFVLDRFTEYVRNDLS